MADKPIDLEQVAKLQAQLKSLQTKMTKLGGPQAKQASLILSEVAKLASELAQPGDDETKKRDLKNQAARVQDLIKRLR